jgi:hypothetical protein
MSTVLSKKRIAGDPDPATLTQHVLESASIRELLTAVGQKIAVGRQGTAEPVPTSLPPAETSAPEAVLDNLDALLAQPTTIPEIPAEIREQIATLMAQADAVKAAWEAVAEQYTAELDRVEASVRNPRFPQTSWSAGVDPSRASRLLEQLGACLRRGNTAMVNGEAVQRLLDPSLSAADRVKGLVEPTWILRNLADAGTADFFHLLGELRNVLAAVVKHAGSRELIPAPTLPEPPRHAPVTAFDPYSSQPRGGA